MTGMSEPSTKQLFCRGCGVEIFRKRPTGSLPIQCADCRVISVRSRARAQELKVKAGYVPPTTYNCMDCGLEFRRGNLGPLVRRCEECKTKFEAGRAAKRSAEKMAALRLKFETEGRWTKCERCDVDIRCARQKGPAPRWCDPCRNARRGEVEKITRPWARVGECIECGGPTNRETADKRRDMCPKCFDAQRDNKGRWINAVPSERRADAAKYGPSAVRVRGPWNDRFTALDIFRRDRWRCQICLKPVDETLRSPHRMSASLDHVIPRSHDGHDLRANVRLAHRSCNSSRNNRGGNEQLMLLG